MRNPSYGLGSGNGNVPDLDIEGLAMAIPQIRISTDVSVVNNPHERASTATGPPTSSRNAASGSGPGPGPTPFNTSTPTPVPDPFPAPTCSPTPQAKERVCNHRHIHEHHHYNENTVSGDREGQCPQACYCLPSRSGHRTSGTVHAGNGTGGTVPPHSERETRPQDRRENPTELGPLLGNLVVVNASSQPVSTNSSRSQQDDTKTSNDNRFGENRRMIRPHRLSDLVIPSTS